MGHYSWWLSSTAWLKWANSTSSWFCWCCPSSHPSWAFSPNPFPFGGHSNLSHSSDLCETGQLCADQVNSCGCSSWSGAVFATCVCRPSSALTCCCLTSCYYGSSKSYCCRTNHYCLTSVCHLCQDGFNCVLFAAQIWNAWDQWLQMFS